MPNEGRAESSAGVTHGLIRERPKFDPAIIPMDSRHSDAVARLWDRRFGASEEFRDSWIEDAQIETEAPTQGFVAVDGGRLTGFGIATVSDPDYATDYFAVDVDIDPWQQTGIMHIGVVHEDYESRGIGSKLFKHRLRWLIGVAEASGAVGTAWHRSDQHDSRALFEKFGFETVASIDEYYTHCDGHVPCPLCEESCRCDASIYRREF